MIVHEHIMPPCFVTFNGQRYMVPGWTPVEDHITATDVRHINPLDKLTRKEWEVIGSRGKPYMVRQIGTRFTCTCPAGRFRGTCKHVRQIKESLDE